MRNDPNTLRNPYPSQSDLVSPLRQEHEAFVRTLQMFLDEIREVHIYGEGMSCLVDDGHALVKQVSLHSHSIRVYKRSFLIHDQPPDNTLQVIQTKRASLTGPMINAF